MNIEKNNCHDAEDNMEILLSSVCAIVKLIDKDDPNFAEVLEWVEENIDHFEYNAHQITPQPPEQGHFIFFEHYDLMAFKLRWL